MLQLTGSTGHTAIILEQAALKPAFAHLARHDKIGGS
jgi:hypothetical protein